LWGRLGYKRGMSYFPLERRSARSFLLIAFLSWTTTQQSVQRDHFLCHEIILGVTFFTTHQLVEGSQLLIRTARSSDFNALRSIELASFETLRKSGAISGKPSASDDQALQRYLDHGLLYVASDEDDAASGWCGGYVAENFLHVSEVDVHPDNQRRGIGRFLLTALIDEGRARKLDGATLTTDRFAPFNAPFYERLGFAILREEHISPRLSKILEAEFAIGLDPARRVAMALMF
jgi:GNAT superfamily N-acetyltransferase